MNILVVRGMWTLACTFAGACGGWCLGPDVKSEWNNVHSMMEKSLKGLKIKPVVNDPLVNNKLRDINLAPQLETNQISGLSIPPENKKLNTSGIVVGESNVAHKSTDKGQQMAPQVLPETITVSEEVIKTMDNPQEGLKKAITSEKEDSKTETKLGAKLDNRSPETNGVIIRQTTPKPDIQMQINLRGTTLSPSVIVIRDRGQPNSRLPFRRGGSNGQRGLGNFVRSLSNYS